METENKGLIQWVSKSGMTAYIIYKDIPWTLLHNAYHNPGRMDGWMDGSGLLTFNKNQIQNEVRQKGFQLSNLITIIGQ